MIATLTFGAWLELMLSCVIGIAIAFVAGGAVLVVSWACRWVERRRG